MSSAAAVVTGEKPSLPFPAAKRAVVVLVDGLGARNLERAGGHARFLNSGSGQSIPCACAFPSTTVASLTSLATGLSVGEHGLLGYRLWDPAANTTRNLLTDWSSSFPARDWQSAETIFESLSEGQVSLQFIGPPEYARSGFTEATFGAASYLPAKSIAERFEAASATFRSPRASLSYLYIPELDQAAHKLGTGSPEWISLLEDLDSELAKLAGSLRRQDLLVVTADHGIVDVPSERHSYLDEHLPQETLRAVGGDPRVLFLYLETAASSEPVSIERIEQSKRALAEKLQGEALILRRTEVIEAGLYPGLAERFIPRLPELFAFAAEGRALYHRAFAKQKSLAMIGQHGGLSSDEMLVPLKLYTASG